MLGDRAGRAELAARRAYRDREPSLRYLMLDERLRDLRAEPGLLALSRLIGVAPSAEPAAGD